MEALFREVYPGLVRALSASHGDSAADAVQEAFAQAMRHWSRIRSYDDPAAWVRRVALNRLANDRRNRRRDVGRARPVVEVEPPTSQRLEVLVALRSLPPQQRLALALYYLADLDVASVADAMGIATGTVKSHLHDGRASLRNLMELADDS